MSDVSLLNKTKFVVNDQITVHIPTLREIEGESPDLLGTDKDEADVYSIVNLFSATSSDIMVELYNISDVISRNTKGHIGK